MNRNQHVKSFNADSRAKNRIRFTSSKERAKRASADVYRTYKRRTGVVTSAASREERVHHNDQFNTSSRRKKRRTVRCEGSKAVVQNHLTHAEESDEEFELETSTTFQMELDLARDRNSSALFTKLYNDLIPLVGSLPEILHHAKKIVNILLSYILSPYSNPNAVSSENIWMSDGTKPRELFIVNIATTDVLHLLSVLARDLRHEIHPYVHDLILPRIVNDLINPPTTVSDPEMKQQRTLDVTVVESAFRTLSYIFRYDRDALLTENLEGKTKKCKKNKERKPEGCLEAMRKYYGSTLAHKSEFVRRMGAESFAPLIRKLKTNASKKKHIRRVIRSLATSASMSVSFSEKDCFDCDEDCFEPNVKIVSSLERANNDAIDGVATLLFYIIRGVPGRLHSKSQDIVNILLSNLLPTEKGEQVQERIIESYKSQVTFKLISQVFAKARQYVHETSNFYFVLNELHRYLVDVVRAINSREKGFSYALGYLTQLMVGCVSYRNGILLKDDKGSDLENGHISKISQILQDLIEPELYIRMGKRNQAHILKLLCECWKAFPDHTIFVQRISRSIPSVAERINAEVDPIIVIARDLLPFVSEEMATTFLAPEILKATAKRIAAGKGDFNRQMILHTVATSRLVKGATAGRSFNDDKDDLFDVDLAPQCIIPFAYKKALLNSVKEDLVISQSNLTKDSLVRFGYISRCIPFLALVGCEASPEDNFLLVQKMVQRLVELLKVLDRVKISSNMEPDLIVSKALVVEAFVFTISGTIMDATHKQRMKSCVKQVLAVANRFLFQFPKSLLAAKCCAELTIVLKDFEMELNDNTNETFDALGENLRSSNHFLRLHSLRILHSFPQLPFVLDFDDVDMSDDLDESEFQTKSNDGEVRKGVASSYSGMCNIIETLLQIETMPIGLRTERQVTGAINRVETLGRSGKLPALYAEAAVNHMFGVLHIKFQPIWNASVRAIAALATFHETVAWPAMASQLHSVMEASYVLHGPKSSSSEVQNIDEDGLSMSCHDHDLIRRWDQSSGSSTEFFQGQIENAKVCGRVSRHQSTDPITIFEQVWSVLEIVPRVTTKKSRVIVPIFLNFLHNQYFVFHHDDTDAREFKLENHIKSKDMRIRWSRDNLGRKMLQQKLMSFMRMFAEVTGMQQLYKHKLLLVVFKSLLSNPDVAIAQLSLNCIFRYKLPYVRPYTEQLNGLLAKGQLRETLTKLNISYGSSDIDAQHRDELFPLIIRISFGRFMAKGSGTKSSKDSPAARRSAILSFFSGLNHCRGELDYFVYMMVRTFIPMNVDMDISQIGHANKAHFKTMIDQIRTSISTREIVAVPSQRQEGFLNLLTVVIKKVGFGVVGYLPTFMKLILAMLEYAESQRKILGANASEDEMELINVNTNVKERIDDGCSECGPSRTGKIRSLCFAGLADLMVQYPDSTEFITYGKDMWNIIRPALKNLPNSTVNATNTPSLLAMLQTMSSHPNLIRVLEQDDSSVEAVLRCISDLSQPNVIDSALRFVDNLLTEGGLRDPWQDINCTPDRNIIGLKLLKKHVRHLVKQFTSRLKSYDDKFLSSGTRSSKELSILCRITVLIADDSRPDNELSETLTVLCELLIPFLSFDRKIQEKNQLDVLRILSSILPKIGKEVSLSHLQAFARLLGPNKTRIGIKSLEVRHEIVACIEAIAATNQSLNGVVECLKDLNAANPKHVDEWDFDRLLPALNGLGDEFNSDKSWISYSRNLGLKGLMPLMYCCLHLLYDSDGVLSRGASKALRALILSASKYASSNSAWERLIETSLMASMRVGIKTHNITVRRSFILLISVITKSFVSRKSPKFCGDLVDLINEDSPDLDFFLNITHVQIHRRARALARLRKFLAESSDTCIISAQNLSTILLPIASHPIYECLHKSEESYALEAIATVGTIARYLPWGKYQTALWTALMQVPRHEAQERFVVAMICAMIDSFHFNVKIPKSEDFHGRNEEGSKNHTVKELSKNREDFIWKQLDKKLIPTVESYLTKDNIERDGSKNKRIRSPIVLALTKLFQKLSTDIFEIRFPRLLTVICQALKNKDSDERDIARKTLSRVAASIDIKYLSDIVRELAISLNEGYKLHVRSAALHSVLTSLTKTYQRPLDIPNCALPLPFDSCVPAMMDIIQQDIFGTANEMKEVESTKKRLVKEAGGTKSLNSLELIGRSIFFKPSSVRSSSCNFSSVHALVSPFLERLRDPEVPSSTIGKVNEAMRRIVLGISQNTSATSEEMLPFVYATISPFILDHVKESDTETDFYDSDDDEARKLEVSKSRRAIKKENEGVRNTGMRKVFNWAPSQLKDAKDSKSAHEMKLSQKQELRKVEDGVNAPKLTGSMRCNSLKSEGSDLNSPATSTALSFGLSLLHSHLKRKGANCNEAMSDPFVKILAECVEHSTDTNSVLLSMKCLQVLLRFDLPSVPKYQRVLATCILKILSSMACNTQNEMVQSSFKTLTLLLAANKMIAIDYVDNATSADLTSSLTAANTSTNSESYNQILDNSQMQVLISILRSALTDAEHHNATFGVIKAITSRKYMSPEYYDLMDKILKMTVQSQKKTMRQQAAKIFMQYLIEYPMGKQRLENHLKQMVLNIKYEYEDGRISALELIKALISKLPLPLLEDCIQVIFLPMVLQLVNDDSKECRECVGECITLLLSRLSTQVLSSLYEYTLRWSQDVSGGRLQRTSIQLFGLFLDARLDFMKKSKRIENLVDCLEHGLESEIDNIDHTSVLETKEWEMIYFCLQAVQKLSNLAQKKELWKRIPLWQCIIKCLAHPHPWVKQVASKIIFLHFSTCNVEEFQSIRSDTAPNIISKIPGSLFEIARNLCFELNSEDEHQSNDVTTMAIKNLTWVIQVMHQCPELCFKTGQESQLADDDSCSDNGNATSTNEKKEREPVTWLITRLSNIAKKRGNLRREAIFKCFASFAMVCDANIISDHLDLILEPLNRVISETEAREERSAFMTRNPKTTDLSAGQLPREVLEILEEKCGTDVFINRLAAVKSKAREKREIRKQMAAAEAVEDPEAAAKRKIFKQVREKQRRKRRSEERRVGRGVITKKHRHHSR